MLHPGILTVTVSGSPDFEHQQSSVRSAERLSAASITVLVAKVSKP